MTSIREGQSYVNARAEECYAVGMALGEPAVLFKGEEYFVIGFYFARKSDGNRELYYVLRPTDDYGNGLRPLERKRLNYAVR